LVRGRIDYILEFILLWIQIQDFFEGFFDILRDNIFLTLSLTSLEKLIGSS